MAEKTKYHTVGIPSQLVELIREELGKPDSVYTSIAEFVQCGTRDLLKTVHEERLLREERRAKIKSQRIR
jgi:hypothetical protein